MTIAILGGRFDPPHWGHLWVAQQVLDFGPAIDEVWLIPAAQHQWKPTIASARDRLRMVSFLEAERIRTSDIELKRGGISYSVDTVKDIKERQHHQIYWIVGSDILPEFPRWEKTAELTRLATFLVFPRDPYTLPSVLPAGFQAIKSPDLLTSNLSSTIIRQRLGEGKSIHGLVPEWVEEYITKRGLYK